MSSIVSEASPIPPSESTAALVLHGRTYGESDRILTFLTRDFGKLSGIAKGALRSKRRFVGVFEPSTEIRLGIRLKTSSDLHFVESADVVRAPRNLTRDLDRYAFTTYVIEVVDCMTEGREVESPVFDLVQGVLARIDQGEVPGPEVLRHFEARLLTLSGLAPRIETCGQCGRPAAVLEGATLDPRTGRLTCARCGEAPGIKLTPDGIEALAQVERSSLAEAPRFAAEVGTQVRVALQSSLSNHFRRPLRSPALLREILGL